MPKVRNDSSSDEGRPGRRPQSNRTDPMYNDKRERNNKAVRKSREKSKQKSKQMEDELRELREANDHLDEEIRTLQEELHSLKQRFIAQARIKKGVVVPDNVLDELLPVNTTADLNDYVSCICDLLDNSKSYMRQIPKIKLDHNT